EGATLRGCGPVPAQPGDGTGAEVAAANEDAAEPDPLAESWIQIFETVSAELGGIADRQIAPWQDGVGVHVVAEPVHPSADDIDCFAHRRASDAGESANGEVILPVTADAAATQALARNTRDSG